jgi:hypothetical protein
MSTHGILQNQKYQSCIDACNAALNNANIVLLVEGFGLD